jgi:prepilin-type N-terminal cleavage/methylation domain-containing protein
MIGLYTKRQRTDRITHMNAHSLLQNRHRSRAREGFSLMELMIVVVITGILAAIAIPTFTGYVQKARTSEAVQFLGVIKLRQEAYRAEFGQYLTHGTVTLPSNITWVGGTPTSKSHEFPSDADFNTLGAKPDGAVRFSYGWAAGGAGVDLSGEAGGEYGLATPHDLYFIAQAKGDLDDDGTFCTYEVTSFTRGVWFTPDQGWE